MGLATTAQRDAIVRSTMIVSIARQDVGYIADSAFRVRVILAWAALPSARVDDVDFSFGVIEAQEPARKNGDRVIPWK